MVLRIFIIFLCLNCFTAHARYNKGLFKKAQYQYKKKNYRKTLSILKKTFNTKKTKSIPSEGMYLLATTYFKLKAHKKSAYYFNYLIKKRYRSQYRKTIKALKQDELDDEFQINRMLKASYYYIGRSYFSLYSKTGKYSFYKNAKRFITICDGIDFNDACSDLLEKLEIKKTYFKKSKKNYRAFFLLGQFYLQDRVNIKETSSGTESVLIGNNTAYCYGGGMRYGNSFEGYYSSGCIYYGTATVAGVAAGETQDNNYSQNGVPIAGIYFDGGYYKLLDNESTRFSISIPVVYRAGTYTNPDGFEITNGTDFNFGIAAGASMKVSFFELETKLNHLGNSNLLMLNLIYNL